MGMSRREKLLALEPGPVWKTRPGREKGAWVCCDSMRVGMVRAGLEEAAQRDALERKTART